MRCEICGRGMEHDTLCPYYIPPKARHYCYVCDGGIYKGEEYIETIDNKCVHYDCLTNLSCRSMIEWLGGEIKEENDEEDY